jgi:DNA-binding NtrC family response regulator
VLVLAIDDEASVLEFYRAALSDAEVQLETTSDATRGLELVRELAPDMVLLDLWMPVLNGLEVLRQIRQHDMRVQVVIVTSEYSIEMAVEAIREGAADYLCKPVSAEKLRGVVEKAKALASERERAESLEKELIEVFSLGGIIGRTPRMLEVFDMIRRVAPHFRTALVLGETGTGKELVAQALHSQSPRSSQRFAVFNCAAVVETLAESQLFGHRKGAFTGAYEDKIGLFEWADGGTVFLDEVGDLTLALQSKLLRVLENQEVQKLGSPQPRHVDVLVIAATSRELNQEVKSGRFRADLWYRLNMIQIQLPPLRERREDIVQLCRHFVEKFNKQYGKAVRGMSPRAQNAVLAYSWPGNVRELENVIGRACMLAQGVFIDLDDLPEVAGRSAATGAPLPSALEEAEKAALVRVLGQTHNKALAARMLGVSRATLYRMMGKHGLRAGESKEETEEGLRDQ